MAIINIKLGENRNRELYQDLFKFLSIFIILQVLVCVKFMVSGKKEMCITMGNMVMYFIIAILGYHMVIKNIISIE